MRNDATHSFENSTKLRSGLLRAGVSAAALCLFGAGSAWAQTEAATPLATQDATDAGAQDPQADEEVVVQGYRQALQSAQQLRRNSDVIVDSVTAEDIGALPDRSVTETLQRIPGVSINRFAAGNDPDHFSVEGSGVVVRGLTYVRSEFNGRDAFSAGNAGGLSFQDVPSELLGGVDVFKSPSADRIEGGIAGVVNLRTRLPFDQKGLMIAGSLELNYGEFVDKSAPVAAILASDRWETGIGEFGLLASFSYSQLYSRADRLGISSFRVRPIYSDGTRTDTLPFGTATQTGEGLFPRGAVMGSQDFNRKRYGYSAAAQWRSNDGSMEATAQFLRSDARQNWLENTIEIATDNVQSNGDSRARAGTSLDFDDSGLFQSGIITGPSGWRDDQNGADARTPALGLQSNNIRREQEENIVTSDYSFNFKWDVSDRLAVNLDYQHIVSSSRITANTLWMSTYQDAAIKLNGKNVPDVSFLPPQNCESANFNIATGSCNGVPGTAAYPAYYTGAHQSFIDPFNSFPRAAMDHTEDSDGNSDAARIDLEYTFPDGGFLKAIRAGARYADRDTTARFSTYNWGRLSEQWGNGGPVWLDDNVDGIPGGNGGAPLGNYTPVFFHNFLGGQANNPVGGQGRLFYAGRPATNYDAYANYANQIINEWVPKIACSIDGRLINDGWNRLSERCGVNSGTNYLPGEINPQSETNKAAYIMARFDAPLGGMRINGNVGVRYTTTRRESQGFQSFPVVTTIPSQAECNDAIADILTNGTGALQAFCAVPQSVRTSATNFLNGALIPNDVDINYDYWLPSLNVRLEAGGGVQFRAAYTKGVSPPSPGLVRNYYVVSLDAQPNTDANGQALPIIINPDGTVPPNQARVEGQFNAGNPYLKPIESDSFDLTGEWYFSRVGSITASLFYKRLKNVLTNDIQRQTFTNNGETFDSIVTTPVNSSETGKIKGIELAYQQTYDFLPGFLKGFGLQANYTYVQSTGVPQAILNPTDPAVSSGQQPTITGADFPLQGLSKHQFNITPFLDIGGLSLRATYNWRSDYLLTLRDVITPFDPIFQRAYGQLDASAFLSVTDNFKIGVQGVNLTKSKTVTEAAVEDQNGDVRRVPRQWYSPDRRFSIITRYTF
ncbi:TonB-dependent receptor [Sphingomonas gei]|uniref:TonB-dependent receptor n=1 Tax=Sphingomonas gei TaxID=1395960 RepID=A0A4S1XE32_9SPHN|nr:TonB-dependent receptor [Sphingomonas gei]TGX54155.1 TonB-dependent receptor [Sphingomonas gei]